MSLATHTFNQFVTAFLNALQADPDAPILEESEGSVELALGEALGILSIMLQNMIVHVNDIARLGSSFNDDVDTFLADWGLKREDPVAATTVVTAGRVLSSVVGIVNINDIVSTLSGVQFLVVPDSTQPYYDAVNNRYVCPIGVNTMTVKVRCVTPGAVGNVLATAIRKIVSGFTGWSTVTNLDAIGNGQERETDTAAKRRFLEYVGGLASANNDAWQAAILGVQPGLTFQIIEYFDFSGAAFGGCCVVVDDGAGAISGPLITTITAAIDRVRAAGCKRQVVAPTNVNIDVTATVEAVVGADPAIVAAAVQSAVVAYINKLGVGVPVSYFGLLTVIQNTPQVQAYTVVTLNGAGVDVAITRRQLARSHTITITGV